MPTVINDRSRLGQEFYESITESVKVPSTPDPIGSNYYFVYLTERPRSSSIVISGLTESTELPNPTEFKVDYDAGVIYFNAAQSGTTYSVTYLGLGSVIKASDINEKISKTAYVLKVKNATVATIAKNKVVKIVSYDDINNVARIELVTSVTDVPLGIITEQITSNELGEVMVFGLLENSINSTASTLGAPIYYTATGTLTLSVTGSIPIGEVVKLSTSGVMRANFLGTTATAGLVTTWIALSDTDSSYTGKTSGQHISVARTDGLGIELKKLKGTDLFVEFEPTLETTINGGPFNGLTYAEKGYTVPSVLFTYASNDVLEFPLALPYADNATINGGGISLVSAGPSTAFYNTPFTEAAHGTGFSLDIHSSSVVPVTDTIGWRYRVYYGKSVNATLSEAQMEALTSNALRTSKNSSYSFASGSGYLWFCWPTTFGTQDLGSFIDTGTGLNIGMDGSSPYTLVGVVNAYGATVNYYLYRSQFPIVGAIIASVS